MLTTTTLIPRDATVRLNCPVVLTARGVRREYPAGAAFRVVAATGSAVLAQDKIGLAVRLPATACDVVSLPGPGRSGGRPRPTAPAALACA